ncbi:MAG: hypothetical protein ACR2MO_11675 [Acidimicrobiales bacterium]
MNEKLLEKSPNVPTEERALARLKRSVELGELELIPWPIPIALPRYLVTYMNSQTGGRIRSATVVSVTNQADKPIRVVVTWFKGFSDNSSPVGTTSFAIPADFTVDFSSRNLPGELTVCNAVCNPELVFDEGRAIVSSTHSAIGVSSRVYYTSGDRDEQLLAITDSKVVVFGAGNNGD